MRPRAALAWLLLVAPGPEPLLLPGFRLHLEVSEDIEPDRLEALAQPGVVLWLRTTSNLVKRSAAERLGRAEASYVEVRPPFAHGVREQFGARVHPWVSLEGLDSAAYRRWAPVGTALELSGSLSEERAKDAVAIHPQAVRWRPETSPTSEEWSRAAGLGGLEVHPSTVLPDCQHPLKGAQRTRLRVSVQEAESSASGCGFALRLEVPPSISQEELRAVLARFPGAELWAHVGNEAEAVAAAALVATLTEALPAPRPPGGHRGE